MRTELRAWPLWVQLGAAYLHATGDHRSGIRYQTGMSMPELLRKMETKDPLAAATFPLTVEQSEIMRCFRAGTQAGLIPRFSCPSG